MFPVNDFPVFLMTKYFMFGVKRFLDSSLQAIHWTCKSFQLTVQMYLSILQVWWKLNTLEIIKTCLFCFLRDCYGDSLDFMFPQLPNLFLPLPMVFPHVSTCVSTISSGVSSTISTVSLQCFSRFLF